MDIKLATKDNLDDLNRIYQEYYSEFLPLNFGNAFAHCLVSKDKKAIGFGWLDLKVEASVILDQNVRPRDKFQALKMIINNGEQVARNAGFNQFYISSQAEKFVNILEKHLEFNRSKSTWLVKNLE